MSKWPPATDEPSYFRLSGVGPGDFGSENYYGLSIALQDPFARTGLATRSLETIHFGPEYSGRAVSLRRAANGEMEMNAQATKLQAVENDLKQLMADVTRAMEKAQEAVARIASKTAPATIETESTISSC